LFGNYEEAVNYFKKAIALDDKNLCAYNNLAVTYARMKKYDEAKKIWKEMLKVNPKYSGALENLKKLERINK